MSMLVQSACHGPYYTPAIKTVGRRGGNTAHNAASDSKNGRFGSSLLPDGCDGCGLLKRQRLEEVLLEVEHRPGVGEGCAADQKHIFDPIAEGVDAGGLQIDAVTGKRARHVIEQARPVAGDD